MNYEFTLRYTPVTLRLYLNLLYIVFSYIKYSFWRAATMRTSGICLFQSTESLAQIRCGVKSKRSVHSCFFTNERVSKHTFLMVCCEAQIKWSVLEYFSPSLLESSLDPELALKELKTGDWPRCTHNSSQKASEYKHQYRSTDQERLQLHRGSNWFSLLTLLGLSFFRCKTKVAPPDDHLFKAEILWMYMKFNHENKINPYNSPQVWSWGVLHLISCMPPLNIQISLL